MTADQIAAERDRLIGLIAKRGDKSGYKKNVLALKAALAAIDKEVPTDE